MDEKYIAAVDLGSSKIALTVAKITGNDIQILYYKERPSAGIRNSAVFNPQKAAEPIREAIEDAQNELKIKIMQVVVGLPRCDVRQELNQARVERTNPDESISLEEVESLKNLAQEDYPLNDPEREELYGAVAQSFSDDEEFQLLESDIVGVISRTFEGNFKLFIGKKSPVRNMDKVFNNLGLATEKKYFTPEAISRAVLTRDEMESGVALIDFGGGSTSVTIYKGNILRHYASIPFGGKVITSDIRTECSIPEELAENIKLAFGACQPDRLQTLSEKIIQIEGDETEGYKQIPVKYLSEIITARVSEILDAILYEIEKSGLADSLRCGIVITGGGANLTNLSNLIHEVSGYNVRMGLPRHLISASGCNEVFNTSATASIGMVLAAKADDLMNCIAPPDYEKVENVAVQLGEREEELAPTEEEPVAPEYTEEPAPEATPVDNGSLFPGMDKEDEEPKKKEKKEKKKEKVKKPGFISVQWQKIRKAMDDMYNEQI